MALAGQRLDLALAAALSRRIGAGAALDSHLSAAIAPGAAAAVAVGLPRLPGPGGPGGSRCHGRGTGGEQRLDMGSRPPVCRPGRHWLQGVFLLSPPRGHRRHPVAADRPAGPPRWPGFSGGLWPAVGGGGRTAAAALLAQIPDARRRRRGGQECVCLPGESP